MFYVYEDWTLEACPRCFYVGQGSLARLRKTKRNKFHTHVAKKFGLKRIAVFESTNAEAISRVETLLVLFRHTFHYDVITDTEIASNFTLGGAVNRGFTYKLNDEQREERRKMVTEINNRPDVIKKHRESALESWQDPIIREKRLKNLQAPETIAARIASLKTPDVRAKIKAGMDNPEVKAKIIASNKRRAKPKPLTSV